MPELILSRDERLSLKAQSHHLNPVVLLGAHGLSGAVIKEIDRALVAHELIKVRLSGDDRDEREQMFQRVADELAAARIQMIGKVIVLFRPRPEESDEEQARTATGERKPAPRSRTHRNEPPSSKARSTARGRPASHPHGSQKAAPRRSGRGR